MLKNGIINPIVNSNILTLQNKSVLGALSAYDDGQIFYFADEDIFEVLNKATGSNKY